MVRVRALVLAICLPAVCLAGNPESAGAASRRPGLLTRVMDYLATTNQPDTTKALDISFLGGPYYTNENKLGIGIIAAGLYRRNPEDPASSVGQVNLYGDVSITGYYKLGIDGVHDFGRYARRLIYDVSFESAPDRYWGIGYGMNRHDGNETEYKRWHARLDCSFLLPVLSASLHIGPHLLLDYLNGRDIPDRTLWRGQSAHTFTNSAGFKLEYDTRDSRFNASRGLYFCADQLFAPRFLGNGHAFSSSELTLSGYMALWKGCVLAVNLHTRLTYGDTPWGLMSKIGGSYSMRGYWEGRYNDKCAADATIEFRQKIWRRHGAVVWAGVGEVFAKPGGLFGGHPLPNCGLGYRWEFKQGVNLRVDYGFGKNQQGIIFNLNEAF